MYWSSRRYTKIEIFGKQDVDSPWLRAQDHETPKRPLSSSKLSVQPSTILATSLPNFASMSCKRDIPPASSTASCRKCSNRHVFGDGEREMPRLTQTGPRYAQFAPFLREKSTWRLTSLPALLLPAGISAQRESR